MCHTKMSSFGTPHTFVPRACGPESRRVRVSCANGGHTISDVRGETSHTRSVDFECTQPSVTVRGFVAVLAGI